MGRGDGGIQPLHKVDSFAKRWLGRWAARLRVGARPHGTGWFALLRIEVRHLSDLVENSLLQTCPLADGETTARELVYFSDVVLSAVGRCRDPIGASDVRVLTVLAAPVNSDSSADRRIGASPATSSGSGLVHRTRRIVVVGPEVQQRERHL